MDVGKMWELLIVEADAVKLITGKLPTGIKSAR